MSTEQNNAESKPSESGQSDGDAAIAAGNGAGVRRPTPTAGAAIRQLRSGSDLAEVQLSEAVFRDALAVRRQQLENADRRSERESGERKESKRLNFILTLVLVIAASIAVLGITVFLVIYDAGGLLGYILSGIGGIIAGAFGGYRYGYANRPR